MHQFMARSRLLRRLPAINRRFCATTAPPVGSESPWASDPWDGIPTEQPPSLELQPASVAIPFTAAERACLPSERAILDAYERRLQERSASHMGYPYNLVYEHDDLHRFLRYSINNLGDPFVTSNYGVHSREFECAVVDFFARLWRIEPSECWGYVTT
jgi:histidine decarboxylase